MSFRKLLVELQDLWLPRGLAALKFELGNVCDGVMNDLFAHQWVLRRHKHFSLWLLHQTKFVLKKFDSIFLSTSHAWTVLECLDTAIVMVILSKPGCCMFQAHHGLLLELVRKDDQLISAGYDFSCWWIKLLYLFAFGPLSKLIFDELADRLFVLIPLVFIW